MNAALGRPYRPRRRLKRSWKIGLCVVGSALVICLVIVGIMVAQRLRCANTPGAGVTVPDWVEVDLLPLNPFSRPGDPLQEINGVVIHYVGNPGTSAQANRNYFESLSSGTDGVYASSHFIVGLEGEVVQCIPLTEIAYASNSRNDDTVAIEVCHPDETGEFSAVTYDRLVELTAWLCETFHLDPAKDVIRHYDVSGKLCPLYYVENPEAWEAFLQDVAAEMKAQQAAE